MESLLQDFRHSLRVLSRQPGFVTAAALSLALGLGVNTAIFSAMNALLLAPLAVRDLDRSVYVYHSTPEQPDRGTSFAAFQHYRDRTDILSSAMAFGGSRPLLLGEGDRRNTVYAEIVSSGFFSIAKIGLQLGRPFDRAVDSAAGRHFVALLSHRLWVRQFASDPDITGKRVVLNGESFTVAGVSRPEFTGLESEVSVDLWIPLTTWAYLMNEPARLTGEEHWLTTVATLKDGVSLPQAQAAMAAAGRTLEPPAGQETKVRSVRDARSGSAEEALAIGAIGFATGLLVLALACMNVTSLLIARAAARQREMSVRTALGCSRSRLVRLWIIESTLVSGAGAIAGLFFAWWMLDLIVAFKPPTVIGDSAPPTLNIAFHPDLRVFAFALGLAALTALAVGLAAGLQSSNHRAPGRRFAPGFNLRSFVVAAQIALSLMLLVPCGLFVRSAMNASSVSPGFATDSVVLLPISTNQAGVRVEKPPDFERHLIERVAGLPGVENATAMDPVPLWFGGRFASYSVEGRPEIHRLGHSSVEPHYFETMKIPLVQGRDFTFRDDGSAPHVAIVSETMARELWPGDTALGKRLRRGDTTTMEIIGVAGDAAYMSLAESPQPFVYQPLAQDPSNNSSLSLGVRVTRDSVQLRDAIAREVRELAPAWPVFQYRTLDEGLALQRQLPRLGATLLGALGAAGLLLAAVGIYGVTAYVVKQRTREIGIRLALGSPGRSVLGLVLRQGMSVCVAGAAAGLLVAFAATRLLDGFLINTGPADPLTYTLVPILLLSVALLACYLPARRVAHTSPLDALRHE